MKQLLILSGKGGTGKTTVATALIHLFDARVFADCDVDAPNLHLMMHHHVLRDQRKFLGMDKAVITPTLCNACGICQTHCRFEAIHYNATTEKHEVNPFACEGCGVCEYVCPVDAVTMVDSEVGTLSLYNGNRVFSTAQLIMGSGNSGLLVTEVKKRMKNAANPKVPIAIIDGSPGIGCPVIASISGVDLVLIVTEPSLSGISDLKRIVETAAGLNATLAVCINQWDVSKENTLNIETFCNDRHIPFVGKIPYDPAVVEAVNKGKSIVEIDCMAGDAVKEIHQNINQLMLA